MSKIMISAAALGLAVSCLATGALARETPNQTTKRLNQQQTQNQAANVPTYTTGAPRMANEAYAPSKVATGVNEAAQPDQSPTVVYVAGAARTSTDAAREPDTNPQSMGTPSIDTPYIAVVPAQK